MKIKAKMFCASVTRSGGQEDAAGNRTFQETVELSAVTYGDNDENKSFSKWTPTASVSMMITNPDAQGAFEPGKEYYVNFAEASLLD